MNAEEALKIVRLAKGAFPATTMDEYTPDAWALALEEERFVDAVAAIKAIMREETFIHVSDIVRRVKRIRRERVLAFGLLPAPPSELADYPEREAAWTKALITRIADGEPVDVPRPALEASPEHVERMKKALASRFGEVPE